SWWSSLTRADILRGLELTGDRLRCDDLGGVQVWGPQDGRRGVTPDPGTGADPGTGSEPGSGSAAPQVRLVQAYDEYIVGYTQTKYVLDLSGSTKTRPVDVTVRNHVLLIDGQVAGHWRRTLTRRSVTIEVTLDRSLNPVEHRELECEAAAHGLFLGLEAILEVR
ncbi:MAG TPA: crosslink repair DNA glycosylase YcaQ family protein, partial [Kineosporiaceae bacterium]|nr:crosslink repair DNA glycosylase YcaQ family protein [Kineosporiaceae bacterium]